MIINVEREGNREAVEHTYMEKEKKKEKNKIVKSVLRRGLIA